jgi:hypothetical protein
MDLNETTWTGFTWPRIVFCGVCDSEPLGSITGREVNFVIIKEAVRYKGT